MRHQAVDLPHKRSSPREPHLRPVLKKKLLLPMSPTSHITCQARKSFLHCNVDAEEVHVISRITTALRTSKISPELSLLFRTKQLRPKPRGIQTRWKFLRLPDRLKPRPGSSRVPMKGSSLTLCQTVQKRPPAAHSDRRSRVSTPRIPLTDVLRPIRISRLVNATIPTQNAISIRKTPFHLRGTASNRFQDPPPETSHTNVPLVPTFRMRRR